MKRRDFAALGAASLLTAAGGPARAAGEQALAMSFGGSSIALWNDIIKLMRPVIEGAGYTFLTHDPQFRVERQVRDWQAWIAQGNVKAIMGWPIAVPALIPVTKQANDAGIKVIGYVDAWQGTAASLLTEPEKDGRQMAANATAWIKGAYGDAPVKVAILSDRQNALGQNRIKGLEEGTKEALPNATVMLVPALTREQGYSAAKAQLAAHPDTTVWLSGGNDNLKGAYKALLDSGTAKDDPKVIMAGMDVVNDDLDIMKIPGSIYRMSFAYRADTLAKLCSELLLTAGRDEKLEDKFIAPELVTAENADNYYMK